MVTNTAYVGPRGYEMGQGGYASYHAIQLVGLGKGLPGQSAGQGESEAINLRKGIVFYFGNLYPSSGAFGKSDAVELVKAGLNLDRRVAGVTGQPSLRDQASSQAAEAESRVREAVLGVMSELGGGGDTSSNGNSVSASYIGEAVKEIAGQVAAVVKSVVKEVMDVVGAVPFLGNLASFVSKMAAGVRKTIIYFSTQDIYKALKSGEPTSIISTLHKRLAIDAAGDFANALYAAAKGVAEAATAGTAVAFTKLIDAIKAALATLYNLYRKVREYYAFKKFSEECKTIFITNDKRLFSAARFSNWFGSWLEELPIIASHCVVGGVTGEPSRFLSAMTSDGTALSDGDLGDAFYSFYELKLVASGYIQKYPHQFSSNDALVNQAVKIAQTGNKEEQWASVLAGRRWHDRGTAGKIKRFFFGSKK